MIRILIIVFLTLLSTSIAAGQKLYKWVDDNGVTHFATQPPADQKNTVENFTARAAPNVIAADSRNQFVALAQVSAPSLCRGAAHDREQCVADQIAAARAVGEYADGGLSPQQRFTIQACQQRHLLAKNRPADFVALQRCISRS